MKAKFTVPGPPQGKARARTVPLKNGKTRSFTPSNTVRYEKSIKQMYELKYGASKFPDDEMLDLRIVAYYSIPKSKPKKTQEKMNCGDIRPTITPDADNIIKVVADALNGVAYKDDKQIVDCQLRKFYSTQPRLEVTILAVKK